MAGNNFFSEIGKSIAKATKRAADSTESAVNSAKMKAQISAEQKEIGKLYQKIGEAVFGGSDENGVYEISSDDRSVFEEIRGRLDYIAKLEDQLAAAKGMKICPSCKELVDLEAAFCPKCGAEFPPRPVTEPEPEEAAAPAEDEGFEEVQPASDEEVSPENDETDILDAEFQQVEDEKPSEDGAVNAEFVELGDEAEAPARDEAEQAAAEASGAVMEEAEAVMAEAGFPIPEEIAEIAEEAVEAPSFEENPEA